METIHLVFDGSFKSSSEDAGMRMGCGVVHYSDDMVVNTRSFTPKTIDINERYGVAIAECYAAILALESVEEGQPVILYGDNKQVINYINGELRSIPDGISEVFEELGRMVNEKASVVSVHRLDDAAQYVPDYLFAIAHNAACEASGAGRLDKIPKHYKGPYAYTPPPAKISPENQMGNGMDVIDLGEDADPDGSHPFDPRFQAPKP